MGLVITHLDKKKNRQVDRYFEECFREHIIDHFKLSPEQLSANAVFGKEKDNYIIKLHFDQGHNHFHLLENGSNPFGTSLKIVMNLEKQMRKHKKESRFHIKENLPEVF